MPPQAGLLEGFSAGLIALGNYIRLYVPDVLIKIVDLAIDQISLQNLPEPIFVGITGTTASYQSMLRTAKTFKACNPDIIIVFGGHHASAQDDIILQHHPYIDFVIRGEGEIALACLLQHYRQPDKVPSLSYRNGSRIERTDDAPLLNQTVLDQLSPLFADNKELLGSKFNRVTYVSARGCPLKCSFCVVRNSAIRAKSVPAVVDDLHQLANWGHTQFAIEDNFFAHQPRRTIELCTAIARLQKNVRFTWDCQTRVESMRRGDIVNVMANANCDVVFLGVESLVPEQLLFLRKTSRPLDYITSLKSEVLPKIFGAGMDVNINIQLGLPGEDTITFSELAQLGRIALQHKRNITVSPQLHVIYPGTPHFHDAVARDRLTNNAFEDFTLWEDANQPVRTYLGEHFAHGTGGIPIGILDCNTNEFSIDDNAIDSLSTQLFTMDNIPGITLLKYG